jgi:hypothetical protein
MNDRLTPETDAEATFRPNDDGATDFVIASFARRLERERDEARDQIEANYKATLMLENMLYQEREQRDMLAEVLRNIRMQYGGMITDPECDCSDCEMLRPIDKALAAVKGEDP